MAKRSKNEITVEALLRLKRSEKPPADFWDSFNDALQQRQLGDLVKSESWLVRLRRPARWIYAGFPVAATVLLVIALASPRPATSPAGESGSPQTAEETATVSKSDFMAEISRAARELSFPQSASEEVVPVETRFVMDAFAPSRDTDARFRKVMASPTFTASIQGSTRYVADPISEPHQAQSAGSRSEFSHF